MGTPDVETVVDATYGALRQSPRPYDHAVPGIGRLLGHYSVGVPTGATTVIAGGGAIFSMRWTDNAALYVLERITVSMGISTVFTTAQVLDIDAIVARGFTAADTGGTSVTLTGQNQKNRSNNMGTSSVADMRVATTAALGAGTKTLDAQAFATAAFTQNNTLGSGSVVELYKNDKPGQHPQVFLANEGINIRLPTTQGAAGVVKYYINIDWAEIGAL